jgi:RNA ligase (TIGR02306 family)
MENFVGKSFTLTEKIDGTSLTVIRKDEEFHVCSRNLSLKEPEDFANAKSVYWQETIRYDLMNKLPNNYAVQGEIAGVGVQGNRLALVGRDLFIFYVYDIKSDKFLPIDEMELFCKDFGLKTVPVLERNWILTPSVSRDDIIKYADGGSAFNPRALREGVVWRLNDAETGRYSFKAISNEYLLKWGE